MPQPVIPTRQKNIAASIPRPAYAPVSQQKTASASALNAYLAHFKTAQTTGNIEIKYFNTPSVQQLSTKYGNAAINDINDLNTRAGKQGQVLNWIGILPQTQLNRIDEIYALSDSLKANQDGKLGIIGIGGSKHTVENLLTLNGVNDKAVFLSAVDPQSINKFIEKLGDLETANIMVASKSGTTLEPSTDYEYVHNAFVQKFKQDYLKQGISEADAINKAEQETSKHFICITDKNADASKLRRIANEKGYRCGIIHDDCGGRFGAFDDHSLTALAYCGMSKENMKKMLESSLKAQKKFLNKDISQNQAAQRAMYNVSCIDNGKINQYDYYFGDQFDGTLLWNTQMKKESHKAQYKVSGDLTGPAFLHNSTESDLDASNKTSFFTFNTIKNDCSKDYRTYNALINGSTKAYSQRHPVSLITLKDLSPESIGEFIELKHFEAIYTGMLLRSSKGIPHPPVLPEVEQPNVKIYKKEVEEILKK